MAEFKFKNFKNLKNCARPPYCNIVPIHDGCRISVEQSSQTKTKGL